MTKKKTKTRNVPLSHSNETERETKKAAKDPNVFIPSPSKQKSSKK